MSSRDVRPVIDGNSRGAASRDGIAAGIVLYAPRPEFLDRLIPALKPQVDRVLVVVNGVIDPALAHACRERHPDLVWIEAPENFGIATALNLLALAALVADIPDLVLFDQDSRPGPDLVERLRRARDDLAAAGKRPAAVGPRLAAPEGSGHKSPAYRRRHGLAGPPGTTPVQFLATSGTLVDLAAFRAIGSFRDDYFIDAVDLEWCFRAWARGYSVWTCDEAVMVHTVGEGQIESRLLRVRTPRQREFRMATYLRNSVYGLRLRHVPPGWKARQVLYLPVQALLFWREAGFAPAVLGRLARAAWQGARGRLGPPADAPHAGPPLDR